MPFNFTTETQFLTKYKSKEGRNTLGQALITDKMIKKDLTFEIEVRSSVFIELTQRGQLDSATIKVFIDKGSVIDSLMV